MRRAGRILGYLCGIAFMILLVVAIFWLVQGTQGIDYGRVAFALFVLAVSSERLIKL